MLAPCFKAIGKSTERLLDKDLDAVARKLNAQWNAAPLVAHLPNTTNTAASTIFCAAKA